jgi:O-antigen/teichoic acid export membrane protein
MTQADKVILSRMVSLEMFGFYMLAWTIASGLSRVVTPLIQAFNPHFTELVSRADDEALANPLRLASQLMSVLILPPVAFIVFFSEPILLAWTGNQAIAKGTAPILAFIMVGTALAVSSHPALSILYSKKQLWPAIVVNLVSMIILLPLLVFAVIQFGVMGAVFIWGLYGLFQYMVFQAYGLRGIHQEGLISSILRDFVAPCLVSLAVAGMAGYWLSEVAGKIAFVVLLGFALIIGWVAALLVCKELFATVMKKLKWKTKTSL